MHQIGPIKKQMTLHQEEDEREDEKDDM